MTKSKKLYVKSKFVSYVLPSVAAMWVYTIYTMVDGIFVARGVSKDALAAVNLSMPLINVAFALGIIMAVGASTKASIYKGQRDYHKANEVFTLGTATIACVGLIVAAVIMLNLDRVALILGATDETIHYVKDYLRVIIMFVPFYMTSYNLEVLIKADGFPTKAIKTSIAGALTNVVLDAVFVLVFRWGITGAAVATGMSQVLTFSIFLRHFMSEKSGFSFVRIRWKAKEALGLAKLGVADFITELSVGVCIFFFNRTLLVVSGNDGVVLYTVIQYFSQLILMTMMGINQGTQPLISYYYGREKKEFYRYIFRIALLCSGACSIVAFLIGTLLPAPIVGVYIDHIADPELYTRGITAMRLYSLAFLPLGTVITLMGYFTALELPKFAMSVSMGRGLVFAVTFLILFAYMWGENGVWLAAAASEGCSLVLALVLYRYQRRKVKHMEEVFRLEAEINPAG